MTPSIQLTILRALAEKPMTTRGVERAVTLDSEQIRAALSQARKMGRIEYRGTCTRDGVYVLTAEGRRCLDEWNRRRRRDRDRERRKEAAPTFQPNDGKWVLELMPRPQV